jgi:multiple sugar transport system permease protein
MAHAYSLRKNLTPYSFLLPSLVIVTVFSLLPIVASFGLSFTRWRGLGDVRFVGLRNYAKILQTEEFWVALKNTSIYSVVTVPVGLVLALGSALLLNQKLRGRGFFRGVIFFPVLISMVVISLIWSWMFNEYYGIVNRALEGLRAESSIAAYLLSSVGLKGPIGWLSNPATALWVIMVMSIWKGFGYGMVIYLAGLQGIPDEYYEAARIDGASRWRQFWHITLPLLNPTTMFVLVIAFIGSFQVFDQVYVMTRGGPGYATTVMVNYVYQDAFTRFYMGRACATAYVLFVIILAFTVVQIKFFSKRTVEI